MVCITHIYIAVNIKKREFPTLPCSDHKKIISIKSRWRKSVTVITHLSGVINIFT